MNLDDMRAYEAIASFALKQAESHHLTTSLFLEWLQTVESRLNQHDQAALIPDPDKAREIRIILAETSRRFSETLPALIIRAKDAIAHDESAHEKLEAFLADLRKKLNS